MIRVGRKHCQGKQIIQIILGYCKDFGFYFEGYGDPLEIFEQRNDYGLGLRGSLCAGLIVDCLGQGNKQRG